MARFFQERVAKITAELYAMTRIGIFPSEGEAGGQEVEPVNLNFLSSPSIASQIAI